LIPGGGAAERDNTMIGESDMRVSISSDGILGPELLGQLEQDTDVEVQESYKEEDLTEQAFAIGEISVVIAVVKGAAALARVLKNVSDRRSSDSQTLRIKTAFGAMTLELRKDVTMDELREQLIPLFAAT
jgi:hypothetical protein